MTYEPTKIKNSKNLGKSSLVKSAEQLHTGTLLWLLVKRHKMGLVVAWAVTMTTLYFVPFVPDLFLSVLR